MMWKVLFFFAHVASLTVVSCDGCGNDPNAHSGCGVNCGRTCSTYQIKDVACILICDLNGCDCNDGYVFDPNVSKCVLPEDCTPTCGLNEVYSSCTNGGCDHRNCSQLGQPKICINRTPESCIKGCVCASGYLRASNGTCITEDKCPASANNQCSGQNEFFDTCISGCSNQTCETIGKTFNCPLQPAVCRTGCRCNPGFYRNASNICVSESQCPTPPCPEGEVYSRCPTVKCEGDYCPKTRDSPLTCPVGIVCDQPRCVCGYLNRRDHKTGKCVRASDCPPFKCDGPNEEYQSCPATCPGENCTDYINDTKCSPFRIGIVVPCKPQCRCRQGYYRNSKGICILASQCEPNGATTSATLVTIETNSTTDKPPSTESGDNNGDGNKNAQDLLETGITAFNGKFLYDRMKASEGENIITSPYSVCGLLAQLALYADGDSLKQLISILNLSSKQDIRSAYPALATSFDGQTSVNFSTAAKVYSNQEYPLSDGFKKDSVDIVHAEAQDVNFSKNTEAANIINTWVESKTNNRIKDLISPSDISALTRLVLVNAIYFKGDWQYTFNKNNTKDANFYLSDGTTKKTKLMYQQTRFNFGEIPELNCTVLEMLYKGKNFSMVIVLPNEKDGVLRTAKNLEDAANFNKVLGSMRSYTVKVYVPPFEINTSTDLATILKQEGVTKIFDSKDSGLSGILKTPENTYVSKAIQKSFIKVDETGSEAAAANAILVGRTAAATPVMDIVFRCDRSFLYYITFQRTVLFSGAFVNPN